MVSIVEEGGDYITTETREFRLRDDNLASYLARAKQSANPKWVLSILVFLLLRQRVPVHDMVASGFSAQELWMGGYPEADIRRANYPSAEAAVLDTKFRQRHHSNLDTEDVLEYLDLLPKTDEEERAA